MKITIKNINTNINYNKQYSNAANYAIINEQVEQNRIPRWVDKTIKF